MIASFAWRDWERVDRIGRVAGGDAARPILSGIYLEPTDDGRVCAVATDSYRLACVTVDADREEGSPVLIPARQVKVATSAFRQLADARLGYNWKASEESIVSLAFKSNHKTMFFEFTSAGNYIGSLIFDLIEGTYPAYRTLLHKPGAELARSTLKRRRKEQIATYIRVQYGRTYDHEELSKDALLGIADDFASKPTSREVGLNPDYLQSLMRTTKVKHQPLRIEMFGYDRPIFFSNPSDKDWQGIQMPVRT